VAQKVQLSTKNSTPIPGSDILIESLLRHDVDTVFAYPGGCAIPMHQSLTRYRGQVRVILPRHEQGGGFAAQGYARATGKVGVCMTTSGPGATNAVTAIADAKLDSIPTLFITGQVGTGVIGTDAFQETPIVEVCRSITKQHYLVTDVNDIAQVMNEAFYVASSGRPGPVLVDLPKNVQNDLAVPNFDSPVELPGYSFDGLSASDEEITALADMIDAAERPIFYVGGGIVSSEASESLRELVKKANVPVTTTLMALGVIAANDPLWLGMPGMHGSVYANEAVHNCDLIITLGARFDDRVTGALSTFAPHAKIAHIEIDRSEVNKVRKADLAIVADVGDVISRLCKKVKKAKIDDWHKQIADWKKSDPLTYDKNYPDILAQHAVETLSKLTQKFDPILTTGVGQHQMWAAQFFEHQAPRRHLTSGGLGTMGFGLPAAMGAKAACPEKLVLCIEGDGSILMNMQEMATCFCEEIPIKVLLLNNQHLGMVMQWEDRFYQMNRAHTYLGPVHHPEWAGDGDGKSPATRYPDFVGIARGFGWGGKSIFSKNELEGAIQEMIESKGSYLLDVQVPYQEHVLPMIPAGTSIAEMIKE